jgi:hypothetical protein
MHADHGFVNQHVALRLDDSCQPADAENQNNTGNNQYQLPNLTGDVYNLVLVSYIIYPDNCWQRNVEQTHYNVDCVKPTVVVVFCQFLHSKLDSV